jgi:hypothetical protein
MGEGKGKWMREKEGEEKYPTDDIFMVTQMRFAVLATVDFMTVQIDVVRETHRNDVCASAQAVLCSLLVPGFSRGTLLAGCNRG